MPGMEQPPQAGPAGAEQPAQGGGPEEAISAVDGALGALAQSAPSPEAAQAFEQFRAQFQELVQQIMSGGASPGTGAVAPEAGGNPRAVPMG